jgi:hypothetical protein
MIAKTMAADIRPSKTIFTMVPKREGVPPSFSAVFDFLVPLGSCQVGPRVSVLKVILT